jgi:L-iditol 2-dehydrogenase
MRALVLEEYGRLAVREVPEPEPGPGEVLVRVRACGICGSDVHGMDGSTGRRIPPVIMGHEAAGELTALGPGVSGWKEGERVTFDSTVYCGECSFCREGRVNLCDRRRVLGVSCGDYRRDGAFAEYVAVPERILYRLPDGLSFRQAAMVEAVSIGAHAVRISPVEQARTVLVVGAGMIGLLLMQALKAEGCPRVLVADVDGRRLDLARELGADELLDASACDVPSVVRALTERDGVDLAFDAAGNAEAFRTAVASVRKGGGVTLVGNLAPEVTMPLQWVVTRELTLQGSCASAGEYPRCLELIASGQVRVDRLISAAAPLEEGPEWFARLYAREPGLMKVILEP